jgi:dipeptidyl aminopeptidase/acylaminoacyl peptidase
MVRPALLSLLLLLAACQTAPQHPANLVVEGVPAIPAELKAELEPYANLGGAGFRGWATSRRAILVTTRIGDATHLHAMAAPLAKRVPLTKGPDTVRSGAFQPKGTLFLYSVDKGGDENFQLWLTDAAKPELAPIRLTDGKSRNTEARWSKDGSLIAYCSNRRNGKDSDILIADVRTPGAPRELVQLDASGWAPVDWTADGKFLLVRQSLGNAASRLWTIEVATGKRTLVSPKGVTCLYQQSVFAEGDRAIYALTNHGSDFLSVMRLDVATGKLSLLVPDPKWDAEELAVSSDGKRLAFAVNVEGFSQLRCWDLESGKELPAPALKPGVLSNLAWRTDSHELGFTLNSEDSPSDAWSLDLDGGALTRWTNRTAKPKKDIPVIQPEVVRTPSFDGVSIPSLVYYPDAKKFPGKRPVLMCFHGGPEGQSRPGYRGSALYYLNELGVALVYPNVRGSTGYGRTYLGLDDTVKRADAVKDVGAVLYWVVRSDRLDAQRIAVYGGSYGGFMSLACLTNYPERFRCGIDNVGISNFVTFLRDTSDYRRGNRRLEYGDERKPEVRAFLEQISPANHAERIRAPLLIIQGRNDPRVPYTEAERMRDAIRAHGGRVWFVMANDEGHGFAKKSNADFQFQATILFLKENLLD